jgi:hypothetical protein
MSAGYGIPVKLTELNSSLASPYRQTHYASEAVGKSFLPSQNPTIGRDLASDALRAEAIGRCIRTLGPAITAPSASYATGDRVLFLYRPLFTPNQTNTSLAAAPATVQVSPAGDSLATEALLAGRLQPDAQNSFWNDTRAWAAVGAVLSGATFYNSMRQALLGVENALGLEGLRSKLLPKYTRALAIIDVTSEFQGQPVPYLLTAVPQNIDPALVLGRGIWWFGAYQEYCVTKLGHSWFRNVICCRGCNYQLFGSGCRFRTC